MAIALYTVFTSPSECAKVGVYTCIVFNEYLLHILNIKSAILVNTLSIFSTGSQFPADSLLLVIVPAKIIPGKEEKMCVLKRESLTVVRRSC